LKIFACESIEVKGKRKDAGKRIEESDNEKGERDEPEKEAGIRRQVYRYTGR